MSINIKLIQDIMRKDEGVDGDAQRIAQLVWVLFLKVFDDKEFEYELMGNYNSPIPENLRWRNWAANEEGITGDELLNFVNNELFPGLKELHSKENSDLRCIKIKKVFEDTYNFMKSGTLLRQVLNEVSKFNFNDLKDRHVFNDIYENILKDLQSAGNAGEYYTTRPVTQYIVMQIDPKLGELILDPACGTGGFLVCAIEYIRSKYVNTIEDELVLINTIIGIEKKPLPYLLCITNMLLHGIDGNQITRNNSLTIKPLKDYNKNDEVDIIITNPPFGGEEETSVKSNFPKIYQTQETMDLFMLLIIKRLKNKGRAAVVLPDGFLFGEGVSSKIKEKLLDECNLHTIIRLPKNVFAPYTDIATNILFFEKGKKTEEIWFYDHIIPDGREQYTKTNPIKIEEFEQEMEWWDNRVENEHSWKVSIEEVKRRNYNLDIKNPLKQKVEKVDINGVFQTIKNDMVIIKKYIDCIDKKLEEINKDMDAKFIPLREILTKSSEKIEIQQESLYTQVTVRLWGKGVIKRNEILGKDIATKTRNICSMNQFIISRIDARSGACGLIPDVLDGSIVSNDFLLFDIDCNIVDPRYLEYISKTNLFIESCKNASSGTTNRVRIKEDKFLDIEIPVIDKDKQILLVEFLETCDQFAISNQNTNYHIESLEQGLLQNQFYKEPNSK